MDEIKQPNTPYSYPLRKPPVTFSTGKGELAFGVWTIVFSLVLCNSLIFSGPSLGFGLAALALLGGTALYLHRRGHRFSRYSGGLLALCAVIAAGFLRSDDGGMKFLMILLLMAVPSLSFCVTAGQNRYSPAGVLSVLDAGRAAFGLGFGCLGEMGRGLRDAFQASGTLGKKTGAVALGLLIAVPVMAVMIPMLMFADAAFEGLMDLLPEFDLEEAMVTVILGGFLGVVLYTRGVALHHNPRSAAPARQRRGMNPLTVNTVLIAVGLVYLVYLFSQLAYFVGGFSGILPEGYTLAMYARRGFFEMGWLCAMNLGLIALAVGLVRKDGRAPRLTRLLCLFIGLITVFLVAAASAKMLLYIGSYGLTRLRVLTEVFMVWLGVTTVLVCVWLFREKLPYMKVSLLLALVLCGGLFWADVDTQVAWYNVRAYQAGRMETVDVEYLGTLSAGAVPYIRELTEDPAMAQTAVHTLKNYYLYDPGDLRGWNWAQARASEILEAYQPAEAAQAEEIND